MPPGKVQTYPNMPGDIGGLRRQTINAVTQGRVNQPSYAPTYAPTRGFTPSSQTRAQAMSGVPAPGAGPSSDGIQLFSGAPVYQQQGGGSQSPGGQPFHPAVPRAFTPDTAPGPSRGGIGDLAETIRNAGSNAQTAQNANQGNILDMLGNLFPQNIPGPPGSPIAPLPGLDYVPVEDIAGPRQATPNFDPRLNGVLDQIIAMSSGGGAGGGGAEGAAVQTQSLDQILNPESEFFKRIMGTYGDAFTQQRSQALAQAKESAGNLTGSGLANTLGTTVNRSLADEQKQLTDALLSAAGVEVGRQTQTGIATAQNQTQASIASAQLRQQALASGRSDLLMLANLLDSQGQNQANREQQINLADFDFRGNRALQNAGTENSLNRDYFSAGVDRNNRQAQMDQERMLAEYAGALGLTGQAANNFTDFINRLLNTGVGPDDHVQQGNPWLDILKSVAPIVGGLAGGGGAATTTGGTSGGQSYWDRLMGR